MSTKYYRVIQNTFMWGKGAILKECKDSGREGGYEPTSDIWDTTDFNEGEYISARIIEKSPKYFRRVYKVNLLTKVVYKTKAQAQELLSKEYK